MTKRCAGVFSSKISDFEIGEAKSVSRPARGKHKILKEFYRCVIILPVDQYYVYNQKCNLTVKDEENRIPSQCVLGSAVSRLGP